VKVPSSMGGFPDSDVPAEVFLSHQPSTLLFHLPFMLSSQGHKLFLLPLPSRIELCIFAIFKATLRGAMDVEQELT
jgi:hypothetical protein